MPGKRVQHEKKSVQARFGLRILIVDDHAIVRDGLKQILSSQFEDAEFGQGQNAQEAFEQVLTSRWDVILLDITMPGQSGLEVLKQIKEVQPAARVLVLTMHPEDQYAIRVLRAGASGYITKQNAGVEVVHAVNKVMAGGKHISPTLAEKLAGALYLPTQKAPHENLSDREYQVLRMLGGGKSVKEIGSDLHLSVKTVSTYRNRVLRKLGFKTNADLIRYAVHEKLVE